MGACEKPVDWSAARLFTSMQMKKALEDYRTGKFSDGSVLIDDLLEAQESKVSRPKERAAASL